MESNLSADFDLVCELSAQGRYDYVIVGSGLGGGILATQLVQKNKKVLLLEKGGLVFSTHCLNTARPHWQAGGLQGPSQDNDVVYNAIKQKVQTAAGSDPYVGGPVYCLGGRSNVWGLFSPEIAKETYEAYFPAKVSEYLEEGYKKAFKLLTNYSQEQGRYPTEKSISITTLKDTSRRLTEAIEDFYKENQTAQSTPTVQRAPIAAEFTSPHPYRFPQGAYSTVDHLLDLVYARNDRLTILLNTEALRISMIDGRTRSLTVRNTSTQRMGQIQAAKGIILCAGTIGTPVIALNSGIQDTLPLVGKGLADHEIWGVRLAKEKDENKDPLKLMCEIKVCGEPALLNVAVNANTFFGRGSALFMQPTQAFDHTGKLMAAISDSDLFTNGDPSTPTTSQADYDTVNITLAYATELSDKSKVLNTATPDPCIYICRPSRRQDEASQIEMQSLATNIRDKLLNMSEGAADAGVPAPRLSLAGFGVVSHEVGTMRMAGPKTKNHVVDANYQVHSYPDLYVCDLSIFPVSPPANPSLTLAALALQLAEQLGGPSAGGSSMQEVCTEGVEN